MHYFSTFLTGFEEIVKETFLSLDPSIRNDYLSDGLVIYKSDLTPDKIKTLPFLNNSFILLKYLENVESVGYLLKKVVNDKRLDQIFSEELDHRTSFRIVVTRENEIIRVESPLLKELENKILQNQNYYLNRLTPEIEFWLILRREGLAVFGRRLTKGDKGLERGEIRKELAIILTLMSDPQKEDVFLDPFSGSGAIPIERALNFPYRQVLAGDFDPKLVNKLRAKTIHLKRKIIVGRWDAQELRTFKDLSIDKIVTDPPWGLASGKNLNLEKFYFSFLKEFKRVLKDDGILVILTAQKELLKIILPRLSFKIVSEYNILVNGQKAGVYKIIKD